jgi:hypothetical protein
MDITIGITTFSKRYNYIEKLIPQIRKHTNNKIILLINGEQNGDFNEDYRDKILKLCVNYNNVYPIFFIETRGLSKLWNTILIHSNTTDVLIFNDDIEIHSNDIFKKIVSHINSGEYNGLTKINNSFSHFLVNKLFIDEIGYFDERLLGFGEEDGDISFRMLKKDFKVNNIFVNDVVNIISTTRHNHIKPGIGKYSNFNRHFIYNIKYKSNLASKYRGMFDTPMEQVIEDIKVYSYESFFWDNKNNL